MGSALLMKLDAGYPPQIRIRILPSTTTRRISPRDASLPKPSPHNGSSFVFTPQHGSWLNIVETLFSKMARTMLRGIRVASKQELN